MESTTKLEDALWRVRNARLEAIRLKREKYCDPCNPRKALPGYENEFEAASKQIESMNIILKVLEDELARARRERVKRKALQLRDMALVFGLVSLVTLGIAAACITVRAPDPITRASAVAGVALSLVWAVKIARK